VDRDAGGARAASKGGCPWQLLAGAQVLSTVVQRIRVRSRRGAKKKVQRDRNLSLFSLMHTVCLSKCRKQSTTKEHTHYVSGNECLLFLLPFAELNATQLSNELQMHTNLATNAYPQEPMLGPIYTHV
jgi:hypothetical protein